MLQPPIESWGELFLRSMKYNEQLRDGRWLQKKSEILSRDKYKCCRCGSTSNLNVHHKYYLSGKMAWEYPSDALITLCETCHQATHDITPYPKKGCFYTYSHSDYDNIMLCYHIDWHKEIVYLFGVDSGAFGTPYLEQINIEDFREKYHYVSICWDCNSDNFDEDFVRSLLFAYKNISHGGLYVEQIRDALKSKEEYLKAFEFIDWEKIF